MPLFNGSTGPVYYRHWATPEPRAAVVFLHGFGEHSGLYHRYAAALGAHQIDLWALDEIGHGLSAGERGQFGSFDDLVANANTLVELAQAGTPGVPIVLAGHSLGSLVALLAALDDPAPFAGVVVSGAPLSPIPWLLEALQSEHPTIDLDPAGLSADPFYLDELENDPLAFTAADIVETLGAAFPGAWARLDGELPALPIPVLAVHGRNDEVAPLDGVLVWRDRFPGLEVEVIDGAAHDILNEVAHREVADSIAGFVLERAAATTQAAA